MKIYKLNLSLRECLDKEWIVTNGIGGFASSTICFANTRRYHGLLTAPTKKNGVRRVFLSKIDEAIVVDGIEYPVYTNMSKELSQRSRQKSSPKWLQIAQKRL